MRRARPFPWIDATRNGNAARLRFAGCTIDVSQRSLVRGDHPVVVEPRVFDFLVFLIEHRERVVSTEELVDAVWEGAAVTTSSLSRAVYKARLAVGDDGEAQRIIRTHHGRGFRFVATVSSLAPAARDLELVHPARPAGIAVGSSS
jgi:DNA-binding winged helix-turn-helix (wHTH) protein